MVDARNIESAPDSTTVLGNAPDLGLTARECLLDRSLEPGIMLIMGASGDLTARKLIPALYSLFLKGALPEAFVIVGCSRTAWNDEKFREKMRAALAAKPDVDLAPWKNFAADLYYHQLEYDNFSGFQALAERVAALHRQKKTAGNCLVYLALPPALYKTVAQMLGRSGLGAEGEAEKGWSRIVVEKPFGHDLQSALDLDRSLHEHFREHQIFRIDHYLAKETVQNVLLLRFANAIFEPVWNRRYIDHVEITAAESLGVGHRAGYYEKAGVLRDMFQNHMMQLLALTAMEPPSQFAADRVRDEKVKVYRALRPFQVDNLTEYLVVGQYGPGRMAGRAVPGYREEPGIDPGSLTPTFAVLRIFLDNWRWQGVPFFLSSGKRLAEKRTEIAIQFKEVPHSMFRQILGEHITANRLILGVYPDEAISLSFQTKNPGAKLCLRSVTMRFDYHQDFAGPVLDAYEKVLLDCLLGDQMLFWRQDGVELCWSFLTPILRQCETCGDRARMLHPYAAGSWGPEAARRLKSE